MKIVAPRSFTYEYGESVFMMTRGIERKQINKDIRKFLDFIEWESDING